MAITNAELKILVVDDDRDIVGWLSQLFRLQGFRVSTAYDGIEALDEVAKEPPDLILMDLMMPNMDGKTAIRHLHQKEETSKIPIIVLSAAPPHNKKARKKMFGDSRKQVKQILQKPTPMMQLMTEVKRCLDL